MASVLLRRSFRSSNNAIVSALTSSSASDAVLLVLRVEAPAPGLCSEARAPPLTERFLEIPFEAVDDVGDDRDGVDAGGSVEGRRPPLMPAGGFFGAVDISNTGCKV